MLTALHAGLRASELLSLTWQDVDFQRRMVTVQAGYAKNGESRSLLMNTSLTTTLKALRMNAPDDCAVFRTSQGTPYRNFRTTFERAVCQAALSDFTFHDLRHTFASRLVMSGVDLPTVQLLLGHTGIAMTLRYTHLTSDHKARTAAKLDEFGKKSQQFSQQGRSSKRLGACK